MGKVGPNSNRIRNWYRYRGIDHLLAVVALVDFLIFELVGFRNTSGLLAAGLETEKTGAG